MFISYLYISTPGSVQLTGPHFAVMKVPKCNHKLHPSQDLSLRRGGSWWCREGCNLLPRQHYCTRERCLCVAGELIAESCCFLPSSVVVECSGS